MGTASSTICAHYVQSIQAGEIALFGVIVVPGSNQMGNKKPAEAGQCR